MSLFRTAFTGDRTNGIEPSVTSIRVFRWREIDMGKATIESKMLNSCGKTIPICLLSIMCNVTVPARKSV
jgi:hypothetical protein